jgi:ATP-dependent Lhr-like helicase
MPGKTETKDALSLFHPLVRQWFTEKIGTPTEIQSRAWPEIAKGSHTLVTAPTGSGKTLTAFLWAVNLFLTENRPKETLRVLYISPLKALNNDIRRNLEKPLEELRNYFNQAGHPFPGIHTAVRSGDTDASERRQMLRKPPEIFITTPESLNVLLSSKSGRRLLSGISTVILDEIHAVAPTKRGTYLITAVERLVPLNGEFQRIALSATVKPLQMAADFIGGYMKKEIRGTNEYEYKKRRVTIVQSNSRKKYHIEVSFPEIRGGTPESTESEVWWSALTEAFRKEIKKNRSSLFFANSRRMVEKVTRFINDTEGPRVYSHHGSLSKEIRSVVEKRFKDGELSAIIATSSLELGIDIGSVDEVVLIQSPFSVASAIQRIGRAGHSVGETSRGVFYPIHTRNLVEAAVIAANIDNESIEMLTPLENPLDVLAQVLLSMTLLESKDMDELYAEIRASYPYHGLSRKEFDLVLEMLAGRYAASRIRELKPRLAIDRVKHTAAARDNASMLLFLSGGVIPDRGYFNLRVAETKAKIGELDEEFVWERALGDAFPLGNQIWRIDHITHNDVEVTQVTKSNSLVPFWRAEEMNRSYYLSEKIAEFLEEADNALNTPTFPDFQQKLLERHHMSESAARELVLFLKRQKAETGAPLPHRHHMLVEHFNDPANVSDSKQTVIHTLWGGHVNRPLAFALSAAWEETYDYPLDVFVNNDCIMLNLPHSFGISELLPLVKPGRIRQLIRVKLESTGYFGARFRENAQRALLLPRHGFHKRMPLWMNRLRSKKLLEAVSQYEDFPILLETWRECLNYDFEIETLLQLLEGLAAGEIAVTEVVTTKPSPFADGIIWKQTNQYMYEDDSPRSKLRTNLSDTLLKEVMYSSQLRPRFSEDLLDSFQRKLHRTAPGYSPDTAEELLQWVRERLYIPIEEWDELLSAIVRDHGLDVESLIQQISDRLYFIEPHQTNQKFLEVQTPRRGEPPIKKPPGRRRQVVIALENLPRIYHALEIEPAAEDARRVAEKLSFADIFNDDADETFTAFLAEWLRFYGPVPREFLQEVLCVPDERLAGALETLVEDGRILIDEFRDVEKAAEEVCDSENLEILLRIRRAGARPVVEPLGIDALPLFLAMYQGLAVRGDGVEDLQQGLEHLFGYPARAGVWETDILPARLSPYYTSWLDSLMRDHGVVWFGCGGERVSFCFDSDYELFSNGEAPKEKPERAIELERMFNETRGKFGLTELIDSSGLSSRELTALLWSLAWDGAITNDNYQTVRSGVLNRFKPEQSMEMEGGDGHGHSRGHRYGHGRRVSFSRWRNTRAFTGNWYALNSSDEELLDALDRQELVKDRVRLLFMRYGVLFREILWNELPSLRWGQVFPVLRLMELSGEIVSGHFFKGVPGLQFCTPPVLGLLTRGLLEDAVYWMNATDPASVCGIGLDELRPAFPHRLATTHLVFHGKKLVLVSKKNGKEIVFHVEPGHPRIGEYMEFFKVLVGREFQPVKYISVETVNCEPVSGSPYKEAMKSFGFQKDYKSMVLMKKY